MMKHTPGLWHVAPNPHGCIKGTESLHSVAAREIRNLGSVIVTVAENMEAADARLIAAAPEILEALLNLADCATLIIERRSTGDLQDAIDSLVVDLGDAHVALRKATGDA